MSRLSVNINKIATLRNARGGDVPNLLKVAKDCEKYGAQGITVHPRPDERHIRYQDVYDLKEVVTTEFNIEGYPNKKFIDLVLAIKPEQVTLVPDPPGVLTSDAGWDIIQHRSFLNPILDQFSKAGIRTSIFMETHEMQLSKLSEINTDRIEFYTGPYASAYHNDPMKAIKPYIQGAEIADQQGKGINAGHDLDLKNLSFFKRHIPSLLEVSIGHALISDALYLGLEETIKQYLQALR